MAIPLLQPLAATPAQNPVADTGSPANGAPGHAHTHPFAKLLSAQKAQHARPAALAGKLGAPALESDKRALRSTLAAQAERPALPGHASRRSTAAGSDALARDKRALNATVDPHAATSAALPTAGVAPLESAHDEATDGGNPADDAGLPALAEWMASLNRPLDAPRADVPAGARVADAATSIATRTRPLHAAPVEPSSRADAAADPEPAASGAPIAGAPLADPAAGVRQNDTASRTVPPQTPPLTTPRAFSRGETAAGNGTITRQSALAAQAQTSDAEWHPQRAAASDAETLPSPPHDRSGPRHTAVRREAPDRPDRGTSSLVRTPDEIARAAPPDQPRSLEPLVVAPAAGAAPTVAPASALGEAPRMDHTSAAVNVHLPTPVVSPEFHSVLGVQVSMLVRDGVHHAQLNLTPAEMGPLSVQIALDGTQVQVDFGADSAATRQIIESSVPELAAALRDAGFTLSGGGVSQHSRGQRQSGEDQPNPANPSRGGTDAVTHESVAVRRVGWQVPQGALDLYA